jgi:hypothetical protein
MGLSGTDGESLPLLRVERVRVKRKCMRSVNQSSQILTSHSVRVQSRIFGRIFHGAGFGS